MSANPNQSVPSQDDEEEYYVVPVILVDYRYHTNEHPECFDPDCNCHQQRIADLTQAYQDGLVSPDDATRIASGKTV